MFVLAKLQHNVKIPPSMLDLSRSESVTGILNSELANKVVLNLGLCISFFDMEDTGENESYIFPGEGYVVTPVTFRYIVFRPFIDEILIGTIKCCSREGIQVSMGFFDDIFISPSALQHPSKFSEMEQVWIWEYSTDEGKYDLVMDKDDKIRFKVTSECFKDIYPGRPLESRDILEDQSPYTITGTINEPGLGLLTWWPATE